MNSIAPFNLDLAPLLDWGCRHGDPLEPRAAEAVVGLLALSGARRRTGLPEPAAELVKELMSSCCRCTSAPSRPIWPVPAVLVALIGHTHAAGKLNAKRRDRLIAEVETLRPQFESAMTSPRRVTWARLYSQLLRAEGVDAADPQAVGAWVDAWRAVPTRSGAQRSAWRPLTLPGWSARLGGVRPGTDRRALAAGPSAASPPAGVGRAARAAGRARQCAAGRGSPAGHGGSEGRGLVV